ncbi:GyrI-like domain-containing protein [Xanthobacter autotrophicus DSM 431]|uniref:GyrI-like domain-containing protein n=1 Tax=Xanthobacter nonsaccharivorans TaxID=3119912 RepID=UPI00372B2E6D
MAGCALLGAAVLSAGALPLRAQQAPATPPAAGTPPASPAAPPPTPQPAQTPIDPKAVETVPVAPSGRSLNPQEITLSPVPVLTLGGHATWEEAYDKLVAGLKQADAELKRLGLTRSGDAFVAYTSSDDLGFDYEVQLPFSGTTTQKPQGDMKLGASFAGKVMRFTHAGSFADMDNTYEQIANYLDEKNVEQNTLYIEQYRTDLTTASPEALEIDILVPLP